MTGLLTGILGVWLALRTYSYGSAGLSNICVLAELDTPKSADFSAFGITSLETSAFFTALVIQSLKSIGKENITEKEIEIIKSKLSEQDKKLILAEGQKTTAWIYQVIKRICSEVSNV